VAADFFASGGVGAHHRPLIVGERAGFEEDGIGDGDFADVVQETTAMEGQQLRARQAQRRAEEHAGDRQSLAMAAGTLVALLDGLGERKQDRFGLLERIDGGLVAQHRADARAHDGRMHGPHRNSSAPEAMPAISLSAP